MHYKDLIKETVCILNEYIFEKTKNLLLEGHLAFSILDPQNITSDILAEKLCDYFIALENKTDKVFDKFIETYMNEIDSVVGPHIAKTHNFSPHGNKSDKPVIIVPRTRKYYEKAVAIKKAKPISIAELIDYTRIMMCLYTAALKKDNGIIEKFNYSADCLSVEYIIEALKKEETTAVFQAAKKKRFDTKDPYCADTSTLILTIILLSSIISGKVEGDHDYE